MNEFKLNSESLAPRFYMSRDHRSGGGRRPEVSESLSGTIITFTKQTLMKVFNFPVKYTSSIIGTFKASSIANLAA